MSPWGDAGDKAAILFACEVHRRARARARAGEMHSPRDSIINDCSVHVNCLLDSIWQYGLVWIE